MFTLLAIVALLSAIFWFNLPIRVTSGGATPAFEEISDFSKEEVDQTARPEA